MPLLKTMADLLSQTDLQRGVIEEIIDVDYLWALLPMVKTSGKAYVYNRENTISEADFLAPYQAVNEGAADFTQITSYLKIIAGDVDVDKYIQTTESDTNDQLAIQIAQKSKALARMFRRALINGSSTTNPLSFDGIAALCDPSQNIVAATNGAALSLTMLDELKDAVKLGADCLVMNRAMWRTIRALLRAYNGNTAEMIQIPNFGKQVPSFDGIPVVLDDFISATETTGTATNTSSIYAVRLNEVDGLHAIFGGPSAGIQVENIGTIQNQDATRWRVKWYIGLVLKSTLSLARLSGVIVAG